MEFNDSLMRPLQLLFGHSHVMLVHFPIALIWVAAVGEFWPFGRRNGARPFARTALWFATFFGWLAGVSGWSYADNDPPGSSLAETLHWHRWSGGASVVLITITAFLAYLSIRGLRRLQTDEMSLEAFAAGTKERSRSSARLYRLFLVLSLASVTYAGHLGGSMVHGESFLKDPLQEAWQQWRGVTDDVQTPNDDTTSGLSEPESGNPDGGDAKQSPVLAQVSFTDQILPLFERRCVECHGPRKAKADLRLDAEQYIFHDDPDFWVIERGNPDTSELVRRIELPADDPDIMPSEGDVLTSAEIALVRQWITDGAPF